MPKIDFKGNQPKFLRPELLQHGPIPRPLAGVAPRVVLGDEWWLPTRRIAYAGNNYCCWACGASEALEAHEAYNIDYYTQRMTYIETTAICTKCHQFIHIGLSRMKLTDAKFKAVVLHGYKILKHAKLKMHWSVLPHLPGEIWTYKVRDIISPKPIMKGFADWSKWRLVVNEVEYPPKFKNELEADEFYANRKEYNNA